MANTLEASDNAVKFMIQVVSKPYDFNGHLICISAAIGAAGYSEAGDQEHELLGMADSAMYQAKEAGKGQVVCRGRG